MAWRTTMTSQQWAVYELNQRPIIKTNICATCKTETDELYQLDACWSVKRFCWGCGQDELKKATAFAKETAANTNS